MTIRMWTLIWGILLLTQVAHPKDLSGRIGIGASLQEIDASLTAMSVRYHFSRYVSTSFVAGFDTSDEINATSLGIKVYRHTNFEENLNFYVGVGALIISEKDELTEKNSTGIEIDGILGVEFFLTGLANLGLQFETGIALRTVGGVTLKTIGSGFGGAGIHYYF